MPHKFNAARRHKFARKKYRVTNWVEYNESLRPRGDLTIWIPDEALCQWLAPRRTTCGGQPKYSDMAIKICLTLGVVYQLPLRQTQGLMRGIVRLMGLDIPVPDFPTLSRRGRVLTRPARPRAKRAEPVHLVVDRGAFPLNLDPCNTAQEKPVIYSPFGMGILDVALAHFVHGKAVEQGACLEIPNFFGQ